MFLSPSLCLSIYRVQPRTCTHIGELDIGTHKYVRSGKEENTFPCISIHSVFYSCSVWHVVSVVSSLGPGDTHAESRLLLMGGVTISWYAAVLLSSDASQVGSTQSLFVCSLAWRCSCEFLGANLVPLEHWDVSLQLIQVISNQFIQHVRIWELQSSGCWTRVSR